jgi:hypothetical protein
MNLPLRGGFLGLAAVARRVARPFWDFLLFYGVFSCCTERRVHYFGFFGATRCASPAFRDSKTFHRSSYSLFRFFWRYTAFFYVLLDSSRAFSTLDRPFSIFLG